MESVNKNIAVEPFKNEGTKPKAQGGLLTLKAKTELQPLRVLYRAAGLDYLPGDVVYVRGDAVSHEWVKNVFTIPGVEPPFILCPEIAVQMVVRVPRPTPTPAPSPVPWVFLNQQQRPDLGLPGTFSGDPTVVPHPVQPLILSSDIKPVGHGG